VIHDLRRPTLMRAPLGELRLLRRRLRRVLAGIDVDYSPRAWQLAERRVRQVDAIIDRRRRHLT
jgi:hypothetical protein